MATDWPICTSGHTHPLGDRSHVGDEDYNDSDAEAKYVTSRGDATCSCCDPANGFPCTQGEESES